MSTKIFRLSRTSKRCFLKCDSVSGDRRLRINARRTFRSLTTSASTSPQDRPRQVADFSSSGRSEDRLGRRAREKLVDRDFFFSLLNSASTKREAKHYLNRFKTEPKAATSQPASTERDRAQPVSFSPESLQSGVNLGSFYGTSKSVYDSPVFRVGPSPVEREEPNEKLHLALVKIAVPQVLEDGTINGVAKTLSQLSRLGMACCVVVDPGINENSSAGRKLALEQADRISQAIDKQPDSRSRLLDSVLSLASPGLQLPTVLSRRALLSPLHDGQTVVLTPVACLESAPRAIMVSANDVVLALTKEFAGLACDPGLDEDPLRTAQKIKSLQNEISLDRIILLDPLGGIPAFSGPQRSHVFINMEQEFHDIRDELVQKKETANLTKDHDGHLKAQCQVVSSSESNKPIASFVKREVVNGQAQKQGHQSIQQSVDPLDVHLSNLQLSQQALAMLPPSSSAIIISPLEVSNSARPPEMRSDLSAVGTRRQQNPLIYNLLTDKPMLSSSLPLSRRRGSFTFSPIEQQQPSFATHTTFIKRGMPVTIFPDPRKQPWSPYGPRVRLDDPCIDLTRLVHLIEDSFNRKLDVQDYLKRVNNRIAGLIIAGDYEGGAILTWETPPDVAEDDGSDASAAARMVPYLDKFAVLKRSQGAGGVADIVFNAMVRICFPNGVCWRSRKDNPVNKWYFERSQGTWKLSQSNWTMFWTTPGLPDDSERFQDYEAVCRSIQPSWSDDSNVVD